MLGTNNIDHHRTTDYAAFASGLKGKPGLTASLADTGRAAAILLIGGDPTQQNPMLAWSLRENVRHNRARIYIVNHEEIKLRRQAKAFLSVPMEGYASAVAFLAGDDNALQTDRRLDRCGQVLPRGGTRGKELIVVFGSELRGRDVESLVRFGAGLASVKFACLGDYVNSRGAADMGLLPDFLPGYVPVSSPGAFAEEYGSSLPAEPGLDMLEMFDAAGRGELGALYVVGANPVSRYGIDPKTLAKTFMVVQDMFLTETALLADVVLPAANLYEKSGTVTNSYGDLQVVKKAADRAGVRPDLEMIVRIADRAGVNPKALVPFGPGVRADMGESRGAQMGEADRHAVWLAANHLEIKVSPFDPFAIFDEIQRLVPGYAGLSPRTAGRQCDPR